MKKLITKTVIFLAIPLITILAILIIYDRLFQSDTYQYKTNKSILFVGDSHIGQGLDDKLFENAVNISTNSEAYIYTYYKLVNIIENNPSIESIYLGFSYHNIAAYYDIYTSGIYASTISARYFFLFTLDKKWFFFKQKNIKKLIYLKSIFAEHTLHVLFKKNPYISGYTNSFFNTSVDTVAINKRLDFQFLGNTSRSVSDSNIAYLKKIVALLSANNIKLTFISTPLAPYYKERIPSKIQTTYHKLIDELDVPLISISASSLGFVAEDFIPDGDHLSYQGSQKYSNWLLNFIGN